MTKTVDDVFSTESGEVFDLTGKNFVFLYGKGYPETGYKFYQLTSRGKAMYFGWKTSPDDENWRKWSDEGSLSQVDTLLNDLRENKVLKLKAEYHTNVMDAEQTIFVFQNETQHKRIYCNEFVPKELEKFETFVVSKLVTPPYRAR